MSYIPTVEQARELVMRYNKEPFHLQHAETVSKVMGEIAKRYDPDNEQFWRTVGMLHDIDFELWPEQHCVKANELLHELDVNEDVIQNKAFGDNWLAFYEGAVEWFAIQAGEVITKMLFSERERQFGNRVFFTSNRLQYMSNADKLAAISQLADRGLMNRNELRDILNLPPLPEPWGSQIPARGEYYNVNDAQAPAEDGGSQ